MNKEKCLSDLLAYCLMKGKAVLIGILVGAVLLGGIQGFRQFSQYKDPANSQEKVEAKYEKQMAEYNGKTEAFQQSIDSKRSQIVSLQEYAENSLLMQLDPYHLYATVIEVATVPTGDEFMEQAFDYQTTPIDFVVNKIGYQYWYTFYATDLNAYAGDDFVAELYRREVVTLNRKSGGLLEIRAIGNSEEDTEFWAQTLLDLIYENHAAVAAASYAHDLQEMGRSTKCIIDTGVAETINTRWKSIKTLEDDIAALEKAMGDVKKPSKGSFVSKTDVIKNAVLFAVVGGVVGAILVLLVSILLLYMKQRVITSYEIENVLGLSFLGTMLEGKKGIYALANKVSGERNWKDQDKAAAYAAAMAGAKLGTGKKVLVTSSLSLKEDVPGMEKLLAAIKEQNAQVTFAPDASHSDLFIKELKNSDCVILVESPVLSNMVTINDIKNQIEEAGIQDAGFILLQKPVISKV